MAKLTPPHLRSLYRSLLRELPPTRTPTPLHSTLRESFTSPKTEVDVREATELLTYLRAQRMYATLLERYNPSLRGGTEEDRVRLSARRVGLEMPKGGVS